MSFRQAFSFDAAANPRPAMEADTLDSFMRSLGHDVAVDHRAPIHDRLCRCRACKPGHVGQTSQSLTRIRVAAAIGGIMTAVIVIGHSARASGVL